MSDFAAQLDKARSILPLRRIIEQAGKAPQNNNWRSFPKCPFCEHGGAGLFPAKSHAGEMFKCHHVPCPSGNDALDEIGFIAIERNLSRDEAWKVYFKEAGVWREERYAPSVMPGKAARKARPQAYEDEDERLVQEAIELIRKTGKASISFFQRELGFGYSRAARIISVLEDRKIVGPANGVEPRPILNLPEKETLPSAEPVAEEAATGPESDAGEPSSVSGPPVVPDAERISASSSDVSAQSPLAAAPLSDPPPLAETAGGDKSNPLPPAVAADPPAEAPSLAVAALRWFYDRLTLLEGDRRRLWEKRGLHAPAVEALGFRSNVKENKDLLLQMEQEFPMLALIDSGLWVQSEHQATQAPKPNAQYYGMALVEKRDAATGKKVRDRDGNAIVGCVWDELGPILIPYFDAAGELFHLRPHKGMLSGRTPRFYVVRCSADYRRAHPEFRPGNIGVAALPGITMAKTLFGDVEEWLEDLRAQYAIITEGEFKAAALWQTMNGQPTTIECPAVRQVIVGYDNEDKSNPALPGYQEEDWKRHDAEVWARYLARQIAKEGYDGKVAHIPNEWRDARGKADWDDRLSLRLHEIKVADFEGWKANHPKLRAEFEAVFKKAMPVKDLWQSEMFDSKEERIIKNRLEVISHERELPIGGEDEVNLARRLQRLVPRLKRSDVIAPKAASFLYLLAKQYQDVKGGYYNLKKLTEKNEAVWQLNLQKAAAVSDGDLKRACEIVLKGVPERISDFYLKAQNVLVKASGERVRLVMIHNIHGVKSGLVKLTSEAFASPSKFREWLLNNISGATWRAGERELQALHMDMARDLARKEVEEVPVRMYHADSKCWFFGDVVYTPDGKEVFADKAENIWVRGDGGLTKAYKLSEVDHEGQDFCQRNPKMNPKVEIGQEELVEFWGETAAKFHQTLGDHSAFLSLGAILACGAGPEIYKAFNGMTGLWVHGETRQGKSSVARWLMKIWGFALENGMPLADSTKVGLSIALQQYGEGVVWLEEFQPGAPQWMIEKIKNIHNRESGIKKTFDEGRRKILSTAMVTGIATCSDAQVKSRFVHIQVASKNRQADWYQWFQDHSKRFYLFGRHIMRNRQKFAERTVVIMKEWMSSDMPGLDGRARLVYGAAYAAFVAFNELVPAYGEQMLTDLKTYAAQHAAESVKQVNEQVNVNQFWRDLLDAYKSDCFGVTPAERRKFFKWVPRLAAVSPVGEHQTAIGAEYERYAWKSGYLYLQPSPIIDIMRRHLRMAGRTTPLDQVDLLSQMRTRPYWVQSPRLGKGHSQVFQDGSRVQEYCWCINLDAHELGLVPVSDEVFDASLHPEPTDAIPDPSDIYVAEDRWVDPRKGDLFALVQSLAKAARDEDDHRS